jgi:polyisoprenoid-binding protein YceI
MKPRRFAGILLALALASGVARPLPGPSRPLRYQVEVAGSSVRWELPASFEPIKGVVPLLHGSVDAIPVPTGGWDVQAKITIPAASMRTGNRRRDRTLREKVLETARYPDIVFQLRQFTGDLSRFRPGATFPVQVTGDLTVHGKTALVQLPVDVAVFPNAVILTGSFPVHWKAYGLQDPSFPVLARVKEPMFVNFRLRLVPAE